MEELKSSDAKNKGAQSRVEVLEQELRELKAVLEQERAEKGESIVQHIRTSDKSSGIKLKT